MFERIAPSMLPSAALDQEGKANAANGGEIEITRIINRMRNTDIESVDLDSIDAIENELDMIDLNQGYRSQRMQAPGESILRKDRPTDDNPFFRIKRDY